MAVLGPEKSVPAETLHTTFDLALQETATQRIEWLLTSIRSGAYGAYRRSKTPLQAAYVAFEAGTGEVRAYVSGDPGRPRNIDHLRTGLIRQASTAKGFPLATALEQGMVSLDETVAEIEAKVTPLPSSFWLARLRRASVLDRTLRDALIQSDNYAAVLIVLLVPPSAMTSMKRLGMPVPSTPMAALGTDLVHPLDLAAAYCSFTHGRAVRPTFVTARPTPRVDSTRNDRVWSAHTIASMQGALEGVVRNGTASKAGSALPATARIGGKTGTVDENDEFLFVGYHMVGRDTLCSLLWIGHDRPRPVITKGSAGTVAFPTWAAIGLSTTR